MFKKIDEDDALIVDQGVYRTTEMYEGPEGGLFAKAKGGFVRVKANGATSHSSVKLQLLHREGPVYQDRFGRLCVTAGADRREVMLTQDGGITLARPADPTALPSPDKVA